MTVHAFDNYIDAHMAQSQLESEDIRCWLQDEHTVTINPMLTHAVGGIKLVVAEVQEWRARAILGPLGVEARIETSCPRCAGNNVQLVASTRKSESVIDSVLGYLFTSYVAAPDRVQHCFDCSHEWE